MDHWYTDGQVVKTALFVLFPSEREKSFFVFVPFLFVESRLWMHIWHTYLYTVIFTRYRNKWWGLMMLVNRSQSFLISYNSRNLTDPRCIWAKKKKKKKKKSPDFTIYLVHNPEITQVHFVLMLYTYRFTLPSRRAGCDIRSTFSGI